MEMYNSDGSRSAMCGNSIRCVARYIYEAGYTHYSTEFSIETSVGVHGQRVHVKDGKVVAVTSKLGRPRLERPEIPMKGEGTAINYPLEVAGRRFVATSLSVGNPHTVIFVADADGAPVEEVGPLVEHHVLFPERTNVEFVQVVSKSRLRMRVWERGSGVTLACGSGAAASVVAAVETGRTGRKVMVELALGKLEIHYPEQGELEMTGPAEKVFEGEYDGL